MRKRPNVVQIILILLAIVGIGVVIYFISVRVSSQLAVAPTAPVSQPLAAAPGKGCCKQGNHCQKDESCNSSCVCKKNQPEPTGYGENYTCTSSNCPGPCFSCNSTHTSCIAHPNAANCGGVSTGLGSDNNNCGSAGHVCQSGTICQNGECVSSPVITGTPTAAPTTTQKIPEFPGKTAAECKANFDPANCNNCRNECSTYDCHCQQGDVCTPGQGICNEIVAGTNLTVQQSCRNQNRSWCVNQYGTGMTCCAVGYGCNPSGNGCTPNGSGGGGGGGGGGTTTTTTTTVAPTTPAPTATPVAACTEIKFFLPQANAGVTCVADADCAIANQPEGQFCMAGTGICNTWVAATSSAEVSSKAKPGSLVKFAFTAVNTTEVQVKINNGAWSQTTKNNATGKFDFIYNVPASGTFSISARYLNP